VAALPAAQAGALSPAPPPTDHVGEARVALDAQGRGLAVWAQYVESTDLSTIEVAERRRDGSWRTSFRLVSAPGDALIEPQVAMNTRGDAVVIWERRDPSVGRSINAATRPAGGRFGAPHQLAGPDGGPGAESIAIGEGGDVLAAWGTFGQSGSIVTAFRPAGGDWGGAEPVLHLGPWIVGRPVVAVGPDGRAAVAWQRSDSSDVSRQSVVQVAERPPGGPFTAARDLETSTLALGTAGPTPAIAIDRDGATRVAWISVAGGSDSRAPVATRHSPGGDWSTPEPIGLPEALEPPPFGLFTSPFRPLLAAGRDGTTLLLWDRRVGTGALHTLEWATQPPGGTWGAPASITAPSSSSFWTDLALGASGGAALRRDDDSVYRSTVIANGSPGPTEAVPVPTGLDLVSTPDLAVDDRGTAVVVASTGGPGAPAALATARPAGGAWGQPVTLSTFTAPSADEPVEPSACAAGAASGRVPTKAATRPSASPAQLLAANRRIAQAAIRRAAAVTALLNRGLGPEHLRDGAFCAAAFAGEVWTAGGGTAGGVRPGKRVPLPAVRNSRVKVERVSAARLRADALLVQTAMRRANALVARLDAGLTGREIRDGAIGPAELAAGLEIDGAVAGGAPPAVRPAATRASARPRTGRPSAARLVVNQRIARAALRRVDEVRERIARGLTGADFRPGSIGLRDLDRSLRG
jgi:hypothetical protein